MLNTVAVPDPNNLGDPDAVSNFYAWVAGTSMSAPQVTGAAALVKSENPNANPNRVESILERTASVPEGYDKTFYGAGFLDPLAALEGENNSSGNDGNGGGGGNGGNGGNDGEGGNDGDDDENSGKGGNGGNGGKKGR